MKRILYLLPLLTLSLHAGRFRSIKDGGEARPLNINFDKIDKELSNSVQKTGTQDITGTKYFKGSNSKFAVIGSTATGSASPSLGSGAPSLKSTTPAFWIDVKVGTRTCTMPVWEKN